jgi:two-component system chemotaxis response regulator CheY
MKTLIVEDDFTSRLLLQEFLRGYGEVHLAANGGDAVLIVSGSLAAGRPFDLICLDIMMPIMDGQDALRRIRSAEHAAGVPAGKGARVIMTTALCDGQNVIKAFKGECDAYLVKPIDRAKLIGHLKAFGLVS